MLQLSVLDMPHVISTEIFRVSHSACVSNDNCFQRVHFSAGLYLASTYVCPKMCIYMLVLALYSCSSKHLVTILALNYLKEHVHVFASGKGRCTVCMNSGNQELTIQSKMQQRFLTDAVQHSTLPICILGLIINAVLMQDINVSGTFDCVKTACLYCAS